HSGLRTHPCSAVLRGFRIERRAGGDPTVRLSCHPCVVPRRVPEEIDGLGRHQKRRDGGRSWRRLPPRGQVIGVYPGPRRRAMEPTPPELGTATGSPRGLVVEGREELL